MISFTKFPLLSRSLLVGIDEEGSVLCIDTLTMSNGAACSFDGTFFLGLAALLWTVRSSCIPI